MDLTVTDTTILSKRRTNTGFSTFSTTDIYYTDGRAVKVQNLLYPGTTIFKSYAHLRTEGIRANTFLTDTYIFERLECAIENVFNNIRYFL